MDERSLRGARIGLAATTVLLVAVGIVMVYSASAVYAAEVYHDGFYYLKRHLVAVTAGLIGGMAVMAMDYRRLRPWAKPLCLVAFGLIAATFLPVIGREVAGANRWLRLGSWSVQPSELAGVALIVYLADFLARRGGLSWLAWNKTVPLALLVGSMVVMILAQPDLGTAFCYSAVALTMCLIAGLPWRYLALPALCALPAFYALVICVPYRWYRITAFLNPWADPRGSGFQIIQSFLAFGSGALQGVGLGNSTQKLFYLPAAHTDFIFAIIGEELGFLGAATVIVLFMTWLVFAGRIACQAPDPFSQLLAAGLTVLVALRAIINIGVNIGALPTKGLPLPFISYGGSAVILCLMATALLLNIGRQAALAEVEGSSG